MTVPSEPQKVELPPPKKTKLEPLTSKSPDPEPAKSQPMKLDPISTESEKKEIAEME